MSVLDIATRDPIHRTKDFAERKHSRYWWYQQFKPAYDPPPFASLSDEEWRVVENWYKDTEIAHPKGTGECAVPAISLLHGLIMGNNISRVVQLGHYIGFSTLLLGLALRRMKFDHSLISFDIDPNVTAYTQRWVDEAGLNDVVRLRVGDSAAPANAQEAIEYLGGQPQLIFIDSSHQHDHTIKELDVWYPALQPGGFILMHDVSQYAATFDYTGKGGVTRAVDEWLSSSNAGRIMINGDLTNQSGAALSYRDGCGIGIVQKPLTPPQ